jgi:hypothetical protein
MRQRRGHAPLSPSFWIACSKLEVDQALEIIIPYFPNEVQGVLGNAEVTIDDLLMLPRQSETSLADALSTLISLPALSSPNGTQRPQ